MGGVDRTFWFFLCQVQGYLSSLGEEELEEMKKELIFIKNVFIKQEEDEKMGDGKEEEGGEAQDKGDLSSPLHSSTPLNLCE